MLRQKIIDIDPSPVTYTLYIPQIHDLLPVTGPSYTLLLFFKNSPFCYDRLSEGKFFSGKKLCRIYPMGQFEPGVGIEFFFIFFILLLLYVYYLIIRHQSAVENETVLNIPEI